MKQVPVGIVGVGKMGSALVKGWLKGGILGPKELILFDALPKACEPWILSHGVGCVSDLESLARSCKTLVLAVKPKDIPPCLDRMAKALSGDHLIVSIAAGVTLSSLSSRIPGDCRLARAMPNVAATVGKSASAYCLGPGATEHDGAWVAQLLSSVGLTVQVSETEMDAVTGLSGSGPAYAFVIVDALADAGVLEGLSRDVALRLAAQTLVGAGRMVLDTGKHPCQLKDEVTSPAGTTARGLRALALGGLRGALMRAVAEATERSRELGR